MGYRLELLWYKSATQQKLNRIQNADNKNIIGIFSDFQIFKLIYA